MATVAELMNRAARECKIKAPGAWVPAMGLSHAELKDFLLETVEELIERLDWPDPTTKDLIITGTGVEKYDLPSDFSRLTRDDFAVYETTTTRRAGIPVTSNGGWTFLKQHGSAAGNRYYRLSGIDGAFKIGFYRPLEANQSLTVSYVSKNWNSVGGVGSSEWTNEEAVLLFPRDLVQIGIVWRFRRAKGLPYADRLNEYEGRLSRLINDARGVRTINFGGCDEMRSPFDIPVPDYIPTA
ncbi:phage adaptor protein [Ochrobactrum sp. MYb379]|uniref:phage adaptor protein n=1 Tax=Ochrobactrum sp. MYb379 TaxID=2745275 RepID=UPI003098CCF5